MYKEVFIRDIFRKYYGEILSEIEEVANINNMFLSIRVVSEGFSCKLGE